ncbi:uncharacterized protein KY384_003935 [Bacidia gigantensis]|uniref:uncharacterized protein n=1 Tax=Bacidia gigantensis TaxID=2732470 RepID=UPI001D04E5AD|nr:uncharacterized protein KY384_003935 [Bacidia gigantensis]KAG8532294.1 hypothetical protein KY384_003935 [Bacidia gigantensis]
MRNNGGSKYISFERNPEFGAVIASLADLAGLSDLVKVVIGPSADSIKRLHADGSLEYVDMMFLDHYKPAYTSDLKLCESLRIVRPGTLLAADNVITPGNPPYLKYVRSSVEEKRKMCEDGAPSQDDKANFGDKHKDQYKNRVDEEHLESEARGNPNLVYESWLVNSFEPNGVPDGVEFTKCLRQES